MLHSKPNYASLQETGDIDDDRALPTVYSVEPSRVRWNHIKDLDSFLSRVYEYHQRHGFKCMLVQEILDLLQFIFIVYLTTYLIYGIDYPVLFKDVPLKSNAAKVTLHDVILTGEEMAAKFTFLTWFILTTAAIIWLGKLLRAIQQTLYFWNTKQFFNLALKIDDKDLDNLTWHEVQKKVIAVQVEQQMCIHKRELTELDIYHRILRQRNYFIAMVNKNLLPPRFNVPFIGEVVYWTQGLYLNMKLALFQSPWGPFKDSWHLREDYRKVTLRRELAANLRMLILWLAFINFILCPLTIVWQIMYEFFANAEIIRREPGHLGVRRWSPYGYLYLSHFNELDHELKARLTRAHRMATRYLAAFTDPLGAVFARYIGFMAGAILAVIVSLTIYDEDVLSVEHLITLISALGVTVAICRTMIPDETIPWCPETLLSNVLANTHYLPAGWKGQAHTKKIQGEFQQLFQLRVSGLLEELLSPIITPFVLLFYVAPRSLDIVDFFHNFTVSVTGVGDVCSFAQMDTRKHGNPEWQEIAPGAVPDQYNQGEEGKVELSLIHFTHTNPSWRPPPEAQAFVNSVHMQGNILAATGDYNNCNPNEHLDDSSLRFSSRMDIEQMSPTLYRSRKEGPNDCSSKDMSYSAMYLHDRHSKMATHSRYTAHSVQENTPLLSSH